MTLPIYFFIWVLFCRHTASAPITAGTHTGGGAVTGRPANAQLESTPAMDINPPKIEGSGPPFDKYLYIEILLLDAHSFMKIMFSHVMV